MAVIRRNRLPVDVGQLAYLGSRSPQPVGTRTVLGVIMAFLEITLKTTGENRAAAGEVYAKYKQPFLDEAAGAKSKVLLVRAEDVQVLHGFASVADATAYLSSELFTND